MKDVDKISTIIMEKIIDFYPKSFSRKLPMKLVIEIDRQTSKKVLIQGLSGNEIKNLKYL